MIPRLKITYEKEITSKLMSKLSVKNKHEVPKIEKNNSKHGIRRGCFQMERNSKLV